MLIRVYNSLPNEEIDCESDVTVHTDGYPAIAAHPGGIPSIPEEDRVRSHCQ